MSQKIKIAIANRIYPLTVKNAVEEEGMRKAASKINDLVAQFEKNYAVSDKQDVLAMCALQFASLIEIQEIKNEEELKDVQQKISELNQRITAQLK
ncbi:cell division protein ZapA [Urechidicola sp. KH5]